MTSVRKADWHVELHEGGGFHIIARGAGHKGWDLIVCSREGNPLRKDELHAFGRLVAAAPDLLAVAEMLALATEEGDDLATGTHYIDKAGRIRCKGSFLDAIERARAAIEKATGEQS